MSAETIDLGKLKRDPFVWGDMVVDANKSKIVKGDCRVIFPARFVNANLVEFGKVALVAGYFAMVFDDNRYCVMGIPAMVSVNASTISKFKVNDEEYYQLFIEKGDVLFPTTQVVRKNTMVYYVFTEYLEKGYVPFYMTLEDLAKSLDQTVMYTGTPIGSNNEVFEFNISLIARAQADKFKYYRENAKTLNGVKGNMPVIVSMNNPTYVDPGGLGRIIGPYLSEGIVSNLIHPAEKAERIEAALRN